MDLFTAVIHRLSSFRLRRIEQYALHAEEIQSQQLAVVLGNLKGTRYAEAHGYTDKSGSYIEYCKAIPVVEYETIRPFVNKMLEGERDVLFHGGCDRFAKSSGTSGGRSKFIPVNTAHLKDCHFRGGSDALWLYLSTRPDSRFFRTKGLVLGGSSAPVSCGNEILQGDLSSILIEKMPALGNIIRVPSKSILLMDEWNAKMDAIVASVMHENVGSLSGVPSWMLVMIKKLLQESGKSDLSELWPDLEVFFHGGISFAPYREEYKRIIPSERMQYRETYNASEGFFGIQNDPHDPAFLLMLDYGVFYEFIPLDELHEENPTVVPLSEVKTGIVYAMLISTLGGLYRYELGDTILFTSRNPYKFTIVGRTTHYINAFGEELMVANTDKAIATVSHALHCDVAEYTAAPLVLSDVGKGRHDWIVEFSRVPKDYAQFAAMLDEELRKLNSDYDAKRYTNMTLLPLQLYIVPEGFFATFLEEEGKAGGQHKVPRLKNDRDLIEKLLLREGITKIKNLY